MGSQRRVDSCSASGGCVRDAIACESTARQFSAFAALGLPPVRLPAWLAVRALSHTPVAHAPALDELVAAHCPAWPAAARTSAAARVACAARGARDARGVPASSLRGGGKNKLRATCPATLVSPASTPARGLEFNRVLQSYSGICVKQRVKLKARISVKQLC
jgi:hypothetical protein